MSAGSAYHLAKTNLRKQKADEIIIDIDDRTEHGSRCVSDVGIKLLAARYWFSLWYSKGMKQPHIHITNIFNLNDLTKEQVIKYKKAFYKKYISEEFNQSLIEKGVRGAIPDFSLCESYEEAYHPIPQEGKPHHKYGTPYLKASEFNPDKLSYNFTEPDLYNIATAEESESPETEAVYINASKENHKLGDQKSPFLFQKIASKISIHTIADAFGLSPKGKKLRECPFHGDTNPSLSLNEELGLFRCFGCKVSGNIIKFYAMLKQLRPDFKLGGTPQ